MDEQTISISAKQYAECIMAIQKLNDVYKVACCNFNEYSYMTAIEAIREISRSPYGDEQE